MAFMTLGILLALIALAAHAEHRFTATNLLPLKQYETCRYSAQVSAGTPPQQFNLNLDSMTSNLWLYSSDCWDTVCWQVNVYNHKNSNSYVPNGQADSLEYTNTATLNGYLSSDEFTIAGFRVQNFQFLEVTHLDIVKNQDTLIFNDIDGMLPLGFEGGSRLRLPAFWREVHAYNPTLGDSYSIYFGHPNQQSYLILGGTDSHFYDGSIQYFDLLIDYGWSIRVDSIGIQHGPLQNFAKAAMLMTAQPYIYGPPEAMEAIISQINVESDCSNHDSLPTVELVIQGKQFLLTPHDYILETDVTAWHNGWGAIGQAVYCELGLRTVDNGGLFILGGIFFRKFYTHFDFGNQRVGFAEAKRFS